MWCYNTLEDNEGSISYLLQLDTITTGYVLITNNLVALKGVNPETILTVKRTEWRKFINYFGLSIEADPSRVGKKRIFPYIGYIPSPLSVNLHISRYHL